MAGDSVLVRVGDKEKLTSVSFTNSFNLQRFVDKIVQLHNMTRDTTRVYHKGRILTQLDDSITVEEAGIKNGDIICLSVESNKNSITHQLQMLRKLNNQGVSKCNLNMFKQQIVTTKPTQNEPTINQEQSQKSYFSSFIPSFLSGYGNSTAPQVQKQTQKNLLSSSEFSQLLHRLLAMEEHSQQLDLLDKSSMQPPSPDIIGYVTNASEPLDISKLAKSKTKHKDVISHMDMMDILSQLSGNRQRPADPNAQRAVTLNSIQQILGSLNNVRVAGGAGFGQNRPTIEANPQMVADLVSMGFNQSRARRALKFFRNNVAIATDHLLSSNEEMDDLVFGIEIQNSNSAVQQQQQQQVQSQFVANAEAMTMLLEMGYTQQDSQIALRITNNNIVHAITYMINNPLPLSLPPQFLRSFSNPNPIQSQIRPQMQPLSQPMHTRSQLQSQTNILQQQVSRLEQELQRLSDQSHQFQAVMNQASANNIHHSFEDSSDDDLL